MTSTILALLPLTLSSFLEKYPLPTYQDILVENQVISQGTNICANRYEMIRPIFQLYDRPFKVLEVGAAQGYFSFRIAHEFPHAFCTMIEEDNSHYSNHGSMLFDLCALNSQLQNVCLIRKKIAIEDLQAIQNQEHFDVVIAFLVIHQMATEFDEQVTLLKTLLEMGDHLLIEVADDAAPVFTAFTQHLNKKSHGAYLGQVRRFQDPNVPATGKIFWFKK